MVNLIYLISALFFVFGIKLLSSPKTATTGNLLGSVGMLIAVLTVFFESGVFNLNNIQWILVGLVLGSAVGAITALRVKMTGMPQLVALFNGFGGAASFLVAGVLLYQNYYSAITPNPMDFKGNFNEFLNSFTGPKLQELIATSLSGFIGSVTLSGSLVAFAKLQGLKIVPEKPLIYPGHQLVKLLFLLVSLALCFYVVVVPSLSSVYWVLVGISFVLGVLLVVGIGGADMPIVISLLNSYSGIAAAATGFVLSNTILIVSGSLVGASGIILTNIMCISMNRSLANVLFGGFGGATSVTQGNEIYEGKIKSTSEEEVAMLLKDAQRVCIVPGYGMAVAQAQTPVRILTEAMEKDGIEVFFGIHPVAGRMPGHMNVLLAEENISYDKLKDLEESNALFENTDVVIVLGANDVVNPVARDPKSIIAGMPILDVDKAKTVVNIKRSLSPGFAGIPNPLFTLPNSLMLFKDGKGAMDEIVKAYKEL